MRLFSYFYGYAALRVTESNPFFADLLAQYMAFTGDRLPILMGDRALFSLDGKLGAFCNVEGAR
jgi:hypothetical protein